MFRKGRKIEDSDTSLLPPSPCATPLALFTCLFVVLCSKNTSASFYTGASRRNCIIVKPHLMRKSRSYSLPAEKPQLAYPRIWTHNGLFLPIVSSRYRSKGCDIWQSMSYSSRKRRRESNRREQRHRQCVHEIGPPSFKRLDASFGSTLYHFRVDGPDN